MRIKPKVYLCVNRPYFKKQNMEFVCKIMLIALLMLCSSPLLSIANSTNTLSATNEEGIKAEFFYCK